MYDVKWQYKPVLFLIDCIGSVLFFWLKRIRPPQTPRRILVIRLDHIGDMIMTTPVFANLKRAYPLAAITVLCRPLTAEILQHNPHVDHVQSIEPPWWKRTSHTGWWRMFQAVWRLRRKQFDLVIELHADPRNIILSRLIGGYVIGYDIRGFGFLLNAVARYCPQHAIDRNNAVLNALGIATPIRITLFPLAKKDHKVAQNLIAAHHLKKFIIVNPGTGRPEKEWRQWTELCHAFRDYQIALIGSGADQEACNKISEQRSAINLCGKTSIRQLAALVKRARLVIAPDTGIIHISHAMGTPFVALFGPTLPQLWGYQSKTEISISACRRCPVCHTMRCLREDHRMKCMNQIGVKTVASAARRLLENPERA